MFGPSGKAGAGGPICSALKVFRATASQNRDNMMAVDTPIAGKTNQSRDAGVRLSADRLVAVVIDSSLLRIGEKARIS
jgi:hypothetical protein